MKAHYFTNPLEGGRNVQGDVLFKESSLNEVVGYIYYKMVLLSLLYVVKFWSK